MIKELIEKVNVQLSMYLLGMYENEKKIIKKLSKTVHNSDKLKRENIEKLETDLLINSEGNIIINGLNFYISRFGNNSSTGLVYLITTKHSQFIAKIQLCGEGYNDEVGFLGKATVLNEDGIKPNYPVIYDVFNDRHNCIIYMKREIGTVNNILYDVQLMKINKKELIRQCYITIYLLHNELKIFHCDLSPENMLYTIDSISRCLVYNIKGNKYKIFNEGITVIPFDFGNSVDFGKSFGTCDSLYYDYLFFTRSIIEKILGIKKFRKLYIKMILVLDLIEKATESNTPELKLLDNILMYLGKSYGNCKNKKIINVN